MSIFIIVLVIWLVAYGYIKNGENNSREAIRKKNTSASGTVYSVACDIIDKMAEAYRDEASSFMDANKYFSSEYNKKGKDSEHYDKYDDNTSECYVEYEYNGFKLKYEEYNKQYSNLKWYYDYLNPVGYPINYINEIDKNNYFLCFTGSYSDKKKMRLYHNQEKIWLIAAAKAAGIEIKDTIVHDVYSQYIWEWLPISINETNLKVWRGRFLNAPTSDKELERYLKIAICFKENIKCPMEIKYGLQGTYYAERCMARYYFLGGGNAYSNYTNEKILNTIAPKFKIPTYKEAQKLFHGCEYKPYRDLFYLAFIYGNHYVRRLGYHDGSGGIYIQPYYCPIAKNSHKKYQLYHNGHITRIQQIDKESEERKKIEDKYDL